LTYQEYCDINGWKFILVDEDIIFDEKSLRRLFFLMLIDHLVDKKLIHPPSWLPRNLIFLALMGSRAYGTNRIDSDYDLWGIVIPRKSMIFPHTDGIIRGFGTQEEEFKRFQTKEKVVDKECGKEYDIEVNGIIQYFELARLGNPNFIEGLFAPQTNILVLTPIADMIRSSRHLFLSKLCWNTYKSYSFGMLKKLGNKEKTGKRKAYIDEYSFDIKYAGHLVRLLNEVEDILTIGDIDVQKNREQIKSIHRGEMSEQDIHDYFARKERDLETVYTNSKLPNEPDEAKLKTLLINCLEAHYGNLGNAIVQPDQTVSALRSIDNILEGLKAQKVI
jgi:predicted nucleotidyltransferase